MMIVNVESSSAMYDETVTGNVQYSICVQEVSFCSTEC